MPVVIDELQSDPPLDYEPRGAWSATEEPGWGQKPLPRLHGPTPDMPRNMWDAELVGYTPTEEDHAWWETQLAPETALGPTLRDAESLQRCPTDEAPGWEACTPIALPIRFPDGG